MEKKSIMNALDEYADRGLADVADLRGTVLSQVQELTTPQDPGELHLGEQGNRPSADFARSSNRPYRTREQAAADRLVLPKRTASMPEVSPKVRGSWRSPAIAATLLLVLGSVLVGLFAATNGTGGGIGLGINVPPNPTLVVRELMLTNPGFEDGLAGWGYGPNAKSNATVAHGGERSATIATQDPEAIFGNIIRSVDAMELRGERIRLSGYLKTQDVRGAAQLWMTVVGPSPRGKDFGLSLAFDNMSMRPVTGTQDWRRYELVLDVPDSATTVQFGPWLWGTGQMWIDDLKLEVVSNDVPSTDMYLNSQPTNMGFENGLAPWYWVGQHAQNSQIGIDSQAQHSGKASGYLSMMTATTDERVGLEQIVNAQAYAGKRIRFSAYLKTQGVKNSGGLEVKVDDLLGNAVSQDNVEDSLAHGTTSWAKYEIIVDVPAEAYLIRFGPRLDGQGEVWIDDAQIDIVDVAAPAPTQPTQTPALTTLR